jgi:hypothetical protein
VIGARAARVVVLLTSGAIVVAARERADGLRTRFEAIMTPSIRLPNAVITTRCFGRSAAIYKDLRMDNINFSLRSGGS